MELTVNGSHQQVANDTTLDELLLRAGLHATSTGVAVALNDNVIPKCEWPNTPLHTGDVVEIVRAVQGG